MKPRSKTTRKIRSSARGKNRERSESPAESVASVPDFIDAAPFQHERHCPRYCALINRDAEADPTTSDELDPLQHDLEQILLHNTERQKSLTDQLSILSGGELPSASEIQAESSRGRVTPSASILKQRTTPKAGFSGAGPSSLPLRPTPSKAAVVRSSPDKLKIRISNTPQNRRPRTDSDMVVSPKGNTSFAPVPITDSLGRMRTYFWPQNHIPDKFWQFVSDYCAPLCDEDAAHLKNLLKTTVVDKNSKFYRIPGSGKHYKLRWQEEDSKAAKSAQKSCSAKRRKLSSPDFSEPPAEVDSSSRRSSTRSAAPVARRLSRQGSTVAESPALKNGNADQYCLGTLTERLVQALIEESSVEANGAGLDDFDEAKEMPEMNGMVSPSKTLAKSLNLGNMGALERRIRKELEEQGILDGDDTSESNDAGGSTQQKEEDEVCQELKARQEELRSMAESNQSRLESLLANTERTVQQHEAETRLDTIDQELLELCNRFYCLVPKRKPTGKKERDQLWKAIKDRQKATKALEQASSSTS